MTTAEMVTYAYDQIDPGPSRAERHLEIDADQRMTMRGKRTCLGQHPLLSGDGEEVPFAGHAFERVRAPVFELKS